MHVHSFSYDFHLRVVHQYLVGCHMTLRQSYQLTNFLDDFISHHPDIPKFGRNHVFQGDLDVNQYFKLLCNSTVITSVDYGWKLKTADSVLHKQP